jgi:hypothetical protein
MFRATSRSVRATKLRSKTLVGPSRYDVVLKEPRTSSCIHSSPRMFSVSARRAEGPQLNSLDVFTDEENMFRDSGMSFLITTPRSQHRPHHVFSEALRCGRHWPQGPRNGREGIYGPNHHSGSFRARSQYFHFRHSFPNLLTLLCSSWV